MFKWFGISVNNKRQENEEVNRKLAEDIEKAEREEYDRKWAEMVADARRKLDEEYSEPLTDEEIVMMFDLIQRASRDARIKDKAKFEDMISDMTTQYVAANLRICRLRTDKALARSEEVLERESACK